MKKETAENIIVTLPPPTPNGGLHLGHLAGPFLAGDVFAKAATVKPFVLCYSDTNQSYVRVTAEQQGQDPNDLAHRWTNDIVETLAIFGCETDIYFEPNSESNSFVRDLFVGLYDIGLLVKKPFPFIFSPSRNAFLDEAGVSGYCPTCLASCKCGICEACGHVNSAATLIDPRDTVHPSEPIELREVEVMVLETERFRPDITEFYAGDRPFRFHYRWLVEDVLKQPLPDFPVSVPGDWGISVDHPDFPGQVINAWPEIMADFVYGYEKKFGGPEAGATCSVVNFFGYDNSYFYAVVHVALLIALGRKSWLPDATLINEFYHLDQSKFSTSQNHVLWARDMAVKYDPDMLRFYAAYSCPGFETGNFNEGEMVHVVTTKLSDVWSRTARSFNDAQLHKSAETVSDEAVALARRIRQRIFKSYSLDRFHLRQAAYDIVWALKFIEAKLSEPSGIAKSGGTARELLRSWAEAAYPVLPHAATNILNVLRSDKPLPISLFADGASSRMEPPIAAE